MTDTATQRGLVQTAATALIGGTLGAAVPWMLSLAALGVLLVGAGLWRFGRRWRRPGASAPAPVAPLPPLAPLAPSSVGARSEIILPMDQDDPDLAVIDAITGLPNRRALQRLLDSQCGAAKEGGDSVGVLVFGLKDLGLVRRACGPQAARDVLRQTGERLRTAVGGVGIVGRWGGDEVVALLSAVKADALPLLTERFRHIVEAEPVKLRSGRRVAVSLTAGYALAPHDGFNGGYLVDQARRRAMAGAVQSAARSMQLAS